MWDENRAADLTFVEQLDYYGKLGSQFPAPPLRLLYTASGTQPAATILRDALSVIEHNIYWSAPTTISEANYLAAILNSESARARAAAGQSRGQWGARHFDKVVFNLPIPRYDSKLKLHRDLAAVAVKAEKIAAVVALPEGVKFQRARALVRTALGDAGVMQSIDALVTQLLDGA